MTHKINCTQHKNTKSFCWVSHILWLCWMSTYLKLSMQCHSAFWHICNYKHNNIASFCWVLCLYYHAECCSVGCHHAECNCTECWIKAYYAIIMLNGVLLGVIMQSVIMLNVVILSVKTKLVEFHYAECCYTEQQNKANCAIVMLNVNLLGVVMLNFNILSLKTTPLYCHHVEYCSVGCHHAECHYAECCYTDCQNKPHCAVIM